MKHYLSRAFRAKMKEALTWVDCGEEVVIHRGKEVYIVKKPLNVEAYKIHE